MRLIEVHGELTEVSMRTRVNAMMVKLDYATHMVVDSSGQVLEAWIQYDNGSRESRPIARSGQPGSRMSPQRLAATHDHFISTRAGDIEIDDAWSYQAKNDLGLATAHSSNVDYLSSNVPFRLVKSYMLQGFDQGMLLNLMQTAALAGSASLSRTTARIFEETLDRQVSDYEQLELASYGRGQ